MDLNNIKDTLLPFTDSEFRKSVLASGIVKASPELKNISGLSRTTNSGLAAELQVIRLLKTKNWRLIFHRLKTRVAEVDLIFEKGPQVILVEVKTLNSRWRAEQRLSRKQLIKFKMNRTLLSYFAKKKQLEAFVAWVEANNVITFCKVD